MKRRKDMKKFSRGVACIGIGLVLFSFAGCRASKPDQRPQVQDWTPATASRELYARANDARARKGLQGLSWNEPLAAHAREHAEKMAAKERLSHDGFQRRFDRLSRGGTVTKLTENVAMSKGHADPVGTTVRGWIDSPGHRRNLFDRDVAFTGVGFAISRNGRIYCAQLYGR